MIARTATRFAAAFAAMLILLAPALWNGFPFLQYDTGGYLARWYEGTLEISRSTVYGLFLDLLARPNFWPAIIVQAALTVWMLALALRVYGIGGRMRLVLAVAVLSVTTTLPWLADILLTDIFAGLSVIALHLLIMHSGTLARWERSALIAFIAFASALHSGTLAVLIALIIVGILVALYDRCLVPPVRLFQAVFALALGALLLLSANYVVAKRFVWTPGGVALSFGRMLQDGIVDEYLKDHCPDPRLRLCDRRAELPRNADTFFWGRGVFNELGRFEGMHDEMETIVFESLRDYPELQIKTAVAATLQQLTMAQTGAGVLNSIWHTYGMIEHFAPASLAPMRAAHQQQGDLDSVFATLNRFQVPIALGSTGLLFMVIARALRRRKFADLDWLAATVAIAILVNAFVFGALSGPHNRYGARLPWVATFVLVMIATRATARLKMAPEGALHRSKLPC